MVQVSEWLSGAVMVLSSNDTLASARNLMIRRRIGRVFVVDDSENLLGIVTRTDLATALRRGGPAWRRRPIDEILLGDIMTTKIVACKPDTPLAEAASLMYNHRIGALPVLLEQRLEGVISGHDLARYLAEHGDPSLKVGDYCNREVITVKQQDSLRKIIDTITATPSKRLVVIDDIGQPLGIISPSNLAFLRLSTYSEVTYRRPRAGRPQAGNRTVKYVGATSASDVMTSPVYVTYENEPITTASRRLVELKIGALPVLNSRKQLVGLFSKKEVMKNFSEAES